MYYFVLLGKTAACTVSFLYTVENFKIVVSVRRTLSRNWMWKPSWTTMVWVTPSPVQVQYYTCWTFYYIISAPHPAFTSWFRNRIPLIQYFLLTRPFTGKARIYRISSFSLKTVLWIHEILVWIWIRIRGFVLLTYGYGSFSLRRWLSRS